MNKTKGTVLLTSALGLALFFFSNAAWSEPEPAGVSRPFDGRGFTVTAGGERHSSVRATRASRVRVYVKLKDFSCIQGGSLWIRLGKKWVAQLTGAGEYLVGTAPAGRNRKLYAVDAANLNWWGPRKVYFKSWWTWYRWTLSC